MVLPFPCPPLFLATLIERSFCRYLDADTANVGVDNTYGRGRRYTKSSTKGNQDVSESLAKRCVACVSISQEGG